jgi:hypothetical protein
MTTRHAGRPAYSLLTVLLMLTLLGIALGGLLFFIGEATHTTTAMIERRRVFYACDGMSRQLAELGQVFLAKNTEEDVSETAMQADLRDKLPLITPEGFATVAGDLLIPDKPLPFPVPVETITTGPFSGLQVRLQTIDMSVRARRTATGAVCRSEQTLALGRIALFQFFVFADVPLLDLAPTNGESVFLRGRIHGNGRICTGGAPTSSVDNLRNVRFAVRMDSRVTAGERLLHADDGRCRLQDGFVRDAGIISARSGEQPLPVQPAQDRLFDGGQFVPLEDDADSGCVGEGVRCPGNWRAFALRRWGGRVQDVEHDVQELTLPLDPPVRHVQLGFVANGVAVPQQVRGDGGRPNNRFLVEPELTNDPGSFGRNKLARKAQLRIIDGVWYVKDPGADNDVRDTGDDGPWPGIPIWSDHPGSFTTAVPAMTREGVEGARALAVGQSDIRVALEARADDDPRLQRARWSDRLLLRGVPPTPRRFSYYAFVDRAQAGADLARTTPARPTLQPEGPGLQWGRACGHFDGNGNRFCDVDPPAVVSYGVLARIDLDNGGRDDAAYWMPGFRTTVGAPTPIVRRPTNTTPWCGVPSESVATHPVQDNIVAPALQLPVVGLNDGRLVFGSFPLRGSPLPGDGTRAPTLVSAPNDNALRAAAFCADDIDEASIRRRARLALLEGTRAGFRDVHAQGGDAFNGAQADVLPMNVDLHALQEALADRTPGELGSYFCPGCLWDSFDGTIFVTNTWQGSMLTSGVPDGVAAPMPDPRVDPDERGGDHQPKAPREERSTTGPLPFSLCAGESSADPPPAQARGQRFVEADELPGASPSSFRAPYADPLRRDNSFARCMNKPAQPARAEDVPTGVAAPQFREVATVEAGSPCSSDTMSGSFAIPDCADYSLTTPRGPPHGDSVAGRFRGVRPTVVRVINARAIHRNARKCGPGRNQPCLPLLSEETGTGVRTGVDQLPRGLNFVTNMPLYTVGDVNVTSEVDEVQTGRRATDWVPVMFAADTITTLSNAWDDRQSRWNVATDDDDVLGPLGGFRLREATTTRLHMLVLTGIVGAGFYDGGNVVPLGRSGGGLHNAMRLMENWGGRDVVHVFRGGIVLAWNPVTTQWRVARPGRGTYQPPTLRDWQFDRHLIATVNQPPDTPVFDVTALRSWRRE